MNYQEIFDAEAKKAGIREVIISPGNYGCAYLKTKKIKVPEVKSLYTLATALHEIGHIVNGNIKPVYLGEYKAEMFVREKFREYGLPLKKKIAKRQRDYVAYRVRLSVRRATSTKYRVDSEVLRFIKAKQPGIVHYVDGKRVI